MSPNDIEIVLHFWCSPAAHPRQDAPAVADAIQRFVEAGLFKRSEHAANGIECTDGARVLVEALCATPIPVQKWVMP